MSKTTQIPDVTDRTYVDSEFLADCKKCGKNATHQKFLENVIIGGPDRIATRCLTCWSELENFQSENNEE